MGKNMNYIIKNSLRMFSSSPLKKEPVNVAITGASGNIS